MAKVPVAPDPAVLAAHLDAQDANVDAVALAPVQALVEAPQAANPDQPIPQQAHQAQQAPEVLFCFLYFWSLAVLRPLLFYVPVRF